MSVMIRGEDRTRLKVMGDVEAELPVPPDSAGRYWLSFSDRTLIEAAYGEDDSDVLRLDWRVEWVTTIQRGRWRTASPCRSCPACSHKAAASHLEGSHE